MTVASFNKFARQVQRLRQEQRRLEKRLDLLVPPAARGAKLRTSDKRLLRAALEGELRSARCALLEFANPNARNKDGQTALLLAAYRPKGAAMVELLLQAGADPNIADHAGNTPLLVSADDRRLAVVKRLLDHGANMNAQNADGDTPLTNAASWGSEKVVKLLLSRGADPKLPDGQQVSAAELARQQGHLAIAEQIDKYAQLR